MNPEPAGDDRDRRTGLVVFGIVEILLGGLAGLFVLLMFVGLAISPQPAGSATPTWTLLPAAGLYLCAGVIFVWLGIGSILGRRWARALWLCVSGVGLGMGLLALPMVVYVALVELPRTMAGQTTAGQPAVPHLALILGQIALMVFAAAVYVVIPAAIFLFYRSPHVKRTCERLDPEERWTDWCPLPVLALSLLTGVGAFGVLLFAFGMRMPLPFFGAFAEGTPGLVLVIGYSALMLYVAMGLYRLRMSAWWILLVTMLLVAVSGCLTLWKADLTVLYTKAGFDPAMAKRSAEIGDRMKWVGMIALLPWFVWVLYVRRYFVQAHSDDLPG